MIRINNNYSSVVAFLLTLQLSIVCRYTLTVPIISLETARIYIYI